MILYGAWPPPFPGRLVLGLLLVALLFALVRLVRGPSVPDRVVALDVIASLSAGSMAAFAVVLDQPVFVDAAVVISLVAFLGTVALARFLVRERSR
jgi:multicomponent Na+:H+ antiporter subunit F